MVLVISCRDRSEFRARGTILGLVRLSGGRSIGAPSHRERLQVSLQVRDENQGSLARLARCQLALIEDLVEGSTPNPGKCCGFSDRDGQLLHVGRVRVRG